MDKRYHWRFWFPQTVGKELETTEQVTGLTPGEFMRRCVLMQTVILENLDIGRRVTYVDEAGEHDISEIMTEEDVRSEIPGTVLRYNQDISVGFFIMEERAYAVELLAEKSGMSLDSFGAWCLLLGRRIVQSELAGGGVRLHPEDMTEPINFLLIDNLHWSPE